jgi:hypothetical protein
VSTGAVLEGEDGGDFMAARSVGAVVDAKPFDRTMKKQKVDFL